MYGGTEVDRTVRLMAAILYWMRCWTGSSEYWRGWTHLRC